jgi:uncharacterized membrane protein
LDEPASERTVFDLHAAGLLSDAARDEAVALLNPAHHWWQWASRALLFVGAALVMAGVVFFFAFNWARMSAVAKFGVIEVGLWACAIAAVRKGLDHLSGKVLLLCACVFVGVLFAVYGQVYQTGADAYENYAMWALLILPWVVIARFGALWVLWLTVVNVAITLLWFQVDVPQGFDFYFGLFLILAAVNGLALFGREYGAGRGWPWLARWIRWLLWLAVLVDLSIPTIAFLVEPEFGNGSLLGLLAFLGAATGGFIYFRHRAPDLACLAAAVTATCVALLTLIGKIVFEVSDDAGAFLFFGMMVLGVTSAAAFYLRHLAKGMNHATGA